MIDKAKDWFKGNGREAESEDDVTEEDRAKHEQYANEIETELKGMKANEGESFKDFRQRIQARANELEKEYQPKLTNGIKIDISLTSSAKEDEKDGDVDVKVKIAPNNTEDIFSIEINEKDDDPRSLEEKEQDLDTALVRAGELAQNDDYSIDDIEEKLPSLKEQYNLQTLELIFDTKGDEESIFHFEGKVNPEKVSQEYKKQNPKPSDDVINLQEWSSYDTARKVLNWRAKAWQWNNPSGKEWHHIQEQSGGGTHSVSNLGLISTTKHKTISAYYSSIDSDPRSEQEGIRFRDYVNRLSAFEQYQEGLSVISKLNYSVSTIDKGRGVFQVIE